MKTLSRMIGVALLLSQTGGLAQLEEEEGFSAPPPPSNYSSGGVTAPKTTSPLTEAQKQKLSKAGIEDITSENFPETIESFDFQNADIADVVKAISELTGKNFIIDPNVRGKITITAPSKITVAEAYKAFLSALAINDLALVPSGDFIKVRSARNAQRDGVETYSGEYYPSADQMITRVIHLKHINAEVLNRDVRIFTSKNGEMSIYTPTNSLIISDYGSNIDRIMQIVNALDVPGFDDQMEVIPVKYARAKDIAELVSKIVNKGDTRNQPGGAFSSGIPRFSRQTTAQTTGSAYFTVIPDDRTNSVIVVGNKAGLVKIRKLLSQLDFRMRPEDQGGVYVYQMKFGDAEKVQQTLAGIAKDAGRPSGSGQSPTPVISPITGVQQAPQEIFGSDVKVLADKNTNSLVIVASKTDYETVKAILRKIDAPRDQVFVEAIIMEMKAGDALNYKIGGFQFQGKNGVKAGFNTFEGSQLTDIISNPAGGIGAIIPFGSSSDVVTITPPGGSGTSITVPSLMGFINFLKKTTNANILSTPQILALDNQEAKIEVGDKVVVGTTQSTNGQATVETPQFEEATIRLKIKPFISPSTGSVRMELEASVKQPSLAVTPSGLQAKAQPLAIRTINTNIVVPNSDTAVLGGLMKDDQIETINKVPLLGDIPLLGWLFKSKTTQREKTNLLVFLTPKIIRSQTDHRDLLGNKLDQRLKYIKDTGGLDPYGEVIDNIKTGQTAKAQPVMDEPAAPEMQPDEPATELPPATEPPPEIDLE